MKTALSAVAHHLVDQYHIRFVNQICAAQLTLTLGSHFGQDVAFVSVFALVASRRFLEALGRPAMDLDLWHCSNSALGTLVAQTAVILVNG